MEGLVEERYVEKYRKERGGEMRMKTDSKAILRWNCKNPADSKGSRRPRERKGIDLGNDFRGLAVKCQRKTNPLKIILLATLLYPCLNLSFLARQTVAVSPSMCALKTVNISRPLV